MIVINAGVFSSASTWVSNIARGLLQASGGGPVISAYADSLTEVRRPLPLPDDMHLMLKTHHIKRDLLLLIAAGAAKAIVPMRDPRDCIVSLMQRFHRSFDAALRDVSSSLAHIDAIPSQGVLALRYEDRFAEKRETILKIAAFLGVNSRPETVAKLHHDFSVAEVSALVARIPTMPEGDIVRRVDSIAHKNTGLHTNHITDTLSGKYARLLTPSQLRIAEDALFHALEKHGYGGQAEAGLVSAASFSTTDAAVRSGDRIEIAADERPICAVFGPYFNLPIGDWAVRFRTDVDCGVDIVAGGRLVGFGRSSDLLQFSIDDPWSEVEYRVYTVPTVNAFRGVVLSRPAPLRG
ncbi:MAG: sulfotransferase domain-containing protein [Vicinamibacteria bacterium]|nr:sulfotransferase domain-containing protein [Vicinamibacteria bacterium]